MIIPNTIPDFWHHRGWRITESVFKWQARPDRKYQSLICKIFANFHVFVEMIWVDDLVGGCFAEKRNGKT